VCSATGCSLLLNITNNLNLPVNHHEAVLLNFNNKGVENIPGCKFVNATSNFIEGDVRMLPPDCSRDSCEISIYDKNEPGTIFRLYLLIDDTVVRLKDLYLKKPINVVAKFTISCS